MVLNNKKQYVGNLMKWHLDRRPKSKVLERRNCFVYFCDHFGKYDIHRVTEDELKQWFKDLKKRHGYTKSTLRNIRTSINHFFEHITEENIIAVNPLNVIKFRGKDKRKRGERTVLSPIELEKALEGIQEMSPTILYPFIYILAHTGARLDEIRTLNGDT